MNSINPVSFQGNIRIKTYKDSFYGEFLDDIKTTVKQDEAIKNLASKLVQKDNRTDTWPSPIRKKSANKMYSLLSKIIGKPLRNVENQKVIHYSDKSLVFGDREGKYCGGETISVWFDV